MNRRDFLHPRQIGHAVGEVLQLVESIQSLADDNRAREERAELFQYSRQAMATTFEVLLPLGMEHSFAAAEEALDAIDRFEDQLTIYREASEVSGVNRQAAENSVQVERNLFALLSFAKNIWRETSGAFDIATGTLSKVWGFHRRAGQVPPAAALKEALLNSGMQHVDLNQSEESVRFQRAGTKLNLGSIGKGYALDCAAEILHNQWRIPCALLHGGRSSVFAFGSEPGKSNGWRVGVRHPWRPDERLARVHLCNQGLATSAATFQHLEYNGKKLGHIIDPRSGWPAEGLASATALAPSAAQADALATAFFILGVDKTREYCAAHADIGAILLPQGNESRPVVIGLSENVFTIPYLQ